MLRRPDGTDTATGENNGQDHQSQTATRRTVRREDTTGRKTRTAHAHGASGSVGSRRNENASGQRHHKRCQRQQLHAAILRLQRQRQGDKTRVLIPSSGKTEPIPGGDVRHPGQRWRTSPAALRQVLPHIFLPAVPDCHSADMTKFAAKMKTQ